MFYFDTTPVEFDTKVTKGSMITAWVHGKIITATLETSAFDYRGETCVYLEGVSDPVPIELITEVKL